MEPQPKQRSRRGRFVALGILLVVIAAIAVRMVQVRSDPDRMVDAGKIGHHTILVMAVRDGDLDEVKRLIDRGADVNKPGAVGITPLLMAASKREYAIIELLIENGADMNYLRRESENILSVFIGNGEGGSADHYEVFTLLLGLTDDALAQHFPAIYAAAEWNLPQYVADILDSVKDEQTREALAQSVLSDFSRWEHIDLSPETMEILQRYTAGTSPQ